MTCLSPPQAKRQQRKLNFLITQTELYAHFMSGKANIGGVEGDPAQEEILRKLEDTSSQRQIDIGGGVMVNAGQEDYGRTPWFIHGTVFILTVFHVRNS